MYLGLLLILAAIVCVVLGIVSGGAFTIVLVAVAVIAAVGAVVALASARAAGISGTLTRQPQMPQKGRISPTGPPRGETPATPDEYIEARQKSQ